MRSPSTDFIKPYPAYKASGTPHLGDIPEHWDVHRFKFFYREIDERSTTGTEELMSVSHKTGVTPRKQNVNMFLADSNLGYKVCRPGDIVINTMWAYMAALGVARQEGLVSPSYGVYRPHQHGNMNPDYIDHLLRIEEYRTAYLAKSTGITDSRLRLYPESFLGIPLLCPPLTEQATIVRYLNDADQCIRAYVSTKERLIALLAEERRAATELSLRHQKAENFRLQNVADLVRRPIERNNAETYVPIGLFNKGRGIFLKEPADGKNLGDSDFYWVRKGDLVISGQFAWEGAIALAGESEDGCVVSHRYPILRGKPAVLETEFLLSFFQTEWGQTLLDLYSRGAAGRNRPLNAGYLLKEKIPVPTIEEQRSVVELLRAEKRTRENLAQSMRLLEEYRTRLIADVVTGKIDVSGT